MKYLVWDLKQQPRGARVQVALKGNAANVRLMDSSNYSNYKSGRNHKYVGGLVKKSPVTLGVPSSGHWYVVVDMQGLGGSTNASVKVLPSALPEYRDAPLASVPSLVQGKEKMPFDESDDVRDHDVFISHASEDKDDVVRPLAIALKEKGLSVWYDEFELKIGDSLRRKIDKGLATSKFGIVVLSRNFIKKGWTNYELDGIMTRVVDGGQVLLPIWHDITKKEVVDYSPSLADKLARNTANYTVEEIAEEIAELIKEN
ncbi:DUF1883 domain-containing protein [Cruoricaptor ignavus]|uniref:ADP-ribosyl cyclase/cyclic ADP-ribose hydrolase n=1 Tax=Cruoricaptor ignavus TaxID=1118202 RepID=A0A7M1T416_9FLAO|nr:DUF1883 domain-containing protein [Cruoricaptor ignavus]QOR74057.1 DUF1883 domain-containing protein [Cruoricaptor ignavus]